MSKDRLLVKIDGQLIDAAISITTVPADRVGPEYKKYNYALPNMGKIAYGYSRREALDMLLAVAKEYGWAVFQQIA